MIVMRIVIMIMILDDNHDNDNSNINNTNGTGDRRNFFKSGGSEEFLKTVGSMHKMQPCNHQQIPEA